MLEEEEEKGGGQEAREINIDGGNNMVQENTFKSNIKCKDNWDNLLEEEISGSRTVRWSWRRNDTSGTYVSICRRGR